MKTAIAKINKQIEKLEKKMTHFEEIIANARKGKKDCTTKHDELVAKRDGMAFQEWTKYFKDAGISLHDLNMEMIMELIAEMKLRLAKKSKSKAAKSLSDKTGEDGANSSATEAKTSKAPDTVKENSTNIDSDKSGSKNETTANIQNDTQKVPASGTASPAKIHSPNSETESHARIISEKNIQNLNSGAVSVMEPESAKENFSVPKNEIPTVTPKIDSDKITTPDKPTAEKKDSTAPSSTKISNTAVGQHSSIRNTDPRFFGYEESKKSANIKNAGKPFDGVKPKPAGPLRPNLIRRIFLSALPENYDFKMNHRHI